MAIDTYIAQFPRETEEVRSAAVAEQLLKRLDNETVAIKRKNHRSSRRVAITFTTARDEAVNVEARRTAATALILYLSRPSGWVIPTG